MNSGTSLFPTAVTSRREKYLPYFGPKTKMFSYRICIVTESMRQLVDY